MPEFVSEDVVFSSSMDCTTALFEFNQVKNTKRMNLNSVLNIDKTSKNSILGKLISSCVGKPFSEKISNINLIVSGGFNFELKNKLKLTNIKINDLNEASINRLKSDLLKEIDLEPPNNLHFIIPELNISNQQSTIKGLISEMINEIKRDADSIADSIGLSFFEKKELRRNLESIHLMYIGFPTLEMLEIKKIIRNNISSITNIKKMSVVEILNILINMGSCDSERLTKEYPMRDYIIFDILPSLKEGDSYCIQPDG